MTETASARLAKTARELNIGISFEGHLGDAIEGQFFAKLIAGIDQQADRSAWGAPVVGALLRQMPAQHDDVAVLIDAIDSDDGSPECPVLGAIQGLHCALTCRDHCSRWLAQAAVRVGELHVGEGPDGFRANARAGACLAEAVRDVRGRA
jgi:hypothetical protein